MRKLQFQLVSDFIRAFIAHQTLFDRSHGRNEIRLIVIVPRTLKIHGNLPFSDGMRDEKAGHGQKDSQPEKQRRKQSRGGTDEAGR